MTAFAEAVVAGERPAGERQLQACRRHLSDLKRQHERRFPYVFDSAAAVKRIQFFRYFRHSKGVWAGMPFVLAPFQAFTIGSIYGWRSERDGRRRFRTVYKQLPRKQGKSTEAAGVAIQTTFFDGEPGAEGYVFATKREQADIVFGEAKAMRQSSPHLHSRIDQRSNVLFIEASRCTLKPLGADADTMDGLNVHLAVGDELHAAKTRGMSDVIESATGSRQQPLIYYITTPGFDRASICFEKYSYACAVLAGEVADDTLFAFIADPDDGDDWRDPMAWAKASPGLGLMGQWLWEGQSLDEAVARRDRLWDECLDASPHDVTGAERRLAAALGSTVDLADMVTKSSQAEHNPEAQNTFRRYQLGQWTEQSIRAIDMAKWNGDCVGTVPWTEMRRALKGRDLVLGLDLASTQDICAAVGVVGDEETGYDLLPWMWIPKERIAPRKEAQRIRHFAHQGAILTPDGNVIDYREIRRIINEEIGREFNIREIGVDRWNARQLAVELQDDGWAVTEVRQGVPTLSEPTKKLLNLIVTGKIRHGGHPVLRWMASNFVVKPDPNGNIRPDKEKAADKIDGISAAIDAFALIVAGLQAPKKKASVYQTRGAYVVTAEGMKPLLPSEPAKEPT